MADDRNNHCQDDIILGCVARRGRSCQDTNWNTAYMFRSYDLINHISFDTSDQEDLDVFDAYKLLGIIPEKEYDSDGL